MPDTFELDLIRSVHFYLTLVNDTVIQRSIRRRPGMLLPGIKRGKESRNRRHHLEEIDGTGKWKGRGGKRG
jgi:hypothetical protein